MTRSRLAVPVTPRTTRPARAARWATMIARSMLARPTTRRASAEKFTSALNRALADSMLHAQLAANANWLDRVGAVLEPQACPLVDGLLSQCAVVAASTVAQQSESAVSRQTEDDDGAHALSARAVDGVARAALALFRELDPDQMEQGELVMHGMYDMCCAANMPAADLLAAFAPPPICKVAAAQRNTEELPSYKQAMAGPHREKWEDAMGNEMADFGQRRIFVEVPEDTLPSWVPSLNRAPEVVDMIWVLKQKFNELRELVKFKARAVVNGAHEARVDKLQGRSKAETFAPTVRHSTFKVMTAAMAVFGARAEAAHVGNETAYTPRIRAADVTGAFLQGKQPEDRVRYVRPPPGFRSHDRRGVPVVWRLDGNVYGTTTAPRVWYDTFVPFLKDTVAMRASDADPCLFIKWYNESQFLAIGLYVDDMWIMDNAGPQADADVARIRDRFSITLTENPRHFLNMNVDIQSPSRIKLSMEAYLTSMADRYVPDWRERPTVDLPCTHDLVSVYERALEQRSAQSIPAERLKSYGGKVGALIYTTPCVRVDTCAAIGRLSRALTFPTAELEQCADDVIVFLAQTASDGVTFDGHADGASVLRADSDSDWAVGHSTTGWCLRLAGAVVHCSSKRQTCIAMSSTEAELIAASACAMEVVFVRRLLRDLGLAQLLPTPLYVDNSGAVELARDRKSCHRSRHVDRRYFKVRELVAAGELRVEHIDTSANVADLLTKPLPSEPFHRHRRCALNLPPA
jgi:hypothetical protein